MHIALETIKTTFKRQSSNKNLIMYVHLKPKLKSPTMSLGGKKFRFQLIFAFFLELAAAETSAFVRSGMAHVWMSWKLTEMWALTNTAKMPPYL